MLRFANQRRTLIIVGISAAALLCTVLLVVLLQGKPRDVKNRQIYAPTQSCFALTNGSVLFTNVTASNRTFLLEENNLQPSSSLELPINATRTTCPGNVRAFDVSAEETTSKIKLLELRVSKELVFQVASSGDDFQVSTHSKDGVAKLSCDHVDAECFRNVTVQLSGFFLDSFRRQERKVNIKGVYLAEAVALRGKAAHPFTLPSISASLIRADQLVNSTVCGFTASGAAVFMNATTTWTEKRYLLGNFVSKLESPFPSIAIPKPVCKVEKDWKVADEFLRKLTGTFCHVASNTEITFDGSWRARITGGSVVTLAVLKGSQDIVRVGRLMVYLKSLVSGKCPADKNSVVETNLPADESSDLKSVACGYGGKSYLYFTLAESQHLLVVAGALTVLPEAPAKVKITATNCVEMRLSVPGDWRLHSVRVTQTLKDKCVTDGLRNYTFDGSWRLNSDQVWAYDVGFGVTKVAVAGIAV